MKHFRVSVDMVRCCDLYVPAETAEEAQRKVMEGRLWREEDDESWCEGHLGTEEVSACAEVDENGNEI